MSSPSNGQRLDAVLADLGFGPDTEMVGTGDRVAQWLGEWVGAKTLSPPTLVQTESRATVALRGLSFYSLCAHHLLPFFGTVDVTYAPQGRVAGLGWFGRAVGHFSRRPQVQERLAEQLADAIEDALRPRGVVVRILARHLCVEMRSGATPEVEVVARRGEAL